MNKNHRWAAAQTRIALAGFLVGSLLTVAAPASVTFAANTTSASTHVTPAFVASCNPGRSHDSTARYVVTMGTVSGINGISANILELDPYYSGSNGTGTNSTIMLTNSSYSQWAQLGWFKSKIDGGTVKREAGLEFYLGPSQNYFQWFGSKQVQTQTWYEILFESGQQFNFFVAGSYVANYSGFTPSVYEIFSETHDLADQMPGTTSNVETFRSSTYFTGASHGTQSTVTSGISYNSTYYGGQNLGGGTYYACDKCGAAAAEQPEMAQPEKAILSGNATLTTEDMNAFGIKTATAVASGAESAEATNPATAIDRAQAIAISATEVTLGTDYQVYSGTASRSPNAAPQPVWIVTTPGGTLPFDGPMGAQMSAPALTGVIVDATTGEIWSGFMH